MTVREELDNIRNKIPDLLEALKEENPELIKN